MGNLYNIVKSKHYIQRLIEEGEHEHQDFKFQISDARKIARSISAFANNDGGRLLIGVKDNGNISGIESDEEIYMIEQAASMFCRPPQSVEFKIYRVDGKNVLKVDIKPSRIRPVKAQDDDKKWRAYYRVGDENILAHPLHVKLWLHNRNNDGAQFTYGEIVHEIINRAKRQGSITIEDCMKELHISKQIAEQSIIALCSVGTLAMHYEGNKFIISPGT